MLCDSLQDSYGKNAGSIVEHLDRDSQQALLAALLASNKVSVDSVEDQYVDKLFSQADMSQPDGLLDRCVPVLYCDHCFSSRARQCLTGCLHKQP